MRGAVLPPPHTPSRRHITCTYNVYRTFFNRLAIQL